MGKIKENDLKKNLIVSAVNFHEGGPLSILQDCLRYLDTSIVHNQYNIVALVHKTSIFRSENFEHIRFIEFPKAKSSYFNRLWLEYFQFNKFAKEQEVDYWLSLHDITPTLNRKIKQTVYCHNPSPFRKPAIRDLLYQPSLFFFSIFYKYLYQFNIHHNEYIIVQQKWIKDEFKHLFDIPSHKIIVAKPGSHHDVTTTKDSQATKPLFIFPTLARPFKNIEIIGEAVKFLNKQDIACFDVIITIDGSENKYAKNILNRYKNLPQLKFVGKVERSVVYDYYKKSAALIFPSKLETWGMPISEYKAYDKPIIAAALPYARETLGQYNKAKFFAPNDPKMLATIMRKIIMGEHIVFDEAHTITYDHPVAENWEELFKILLNDQQSD